jgi:hypothetical protein
MIDPAHIPDVSPDEALARYVLYSKYVRQDKTLKPDAFVPHPYRELSVTRHAMASETELWRLGEEVAASQARSLYGRGDFGVAVCVDQNLAVRAAPVPGNPNHAHVEDWPVEKPRQKLIAQQVAAASRFLERA